MKKMPTLKSVIDNLDDDSSSGDTAYRNGIIDCYNLIKTLLSNTNNNEQNNSPAS
jgi:hypothetical protein